MGVTYPKRMQGLAASCNCAGMSMLVGIAVAYRSSRRRRSRSCPLQDFEADHRALDTSRVLRLVDTASSHSSDRVRLGYAASTPTSGGERLATELSAMSSTSSLTLSSR